MSWKNKITVGPGIDPPKAVRSVTEQPAAPRDLSLIQDIFDVNEQIALWIYSESNLRGIAGNRYKDILLSVNPPKQSGLLLSKIRLMLVTGGRLHLSKKLSSGLENLLKSMYVGPFESNNLFIWEKR